MVARYQKLEKENTKISEKWIKLSSRNKNEERLKPKVIESNPQTLRADHRVP
jgi:hypothetical protein